MIFQIKGNKSTRHPSQHLVVNASYTVTDDLYDPKIKHRSFSGVQARAFRVTRGIGSRYSEFSGSSLEAFWQWVYSRCNRKIGSWLWCNDLTGHLVYLRILSELNSGRLTYQRSVLSQKVSFMHCDTGQGHLVLLDRGNWWRSTNEEFTAGKSMIDALSDRVIGLCRWVVENDLGCLRVTAAGQSLAAYRHRLGPFRTWTHTLTRGKRKGETVTEKRLWPRRHDNQEVLALERGAYFGGPTHCYYIGKVDSPVYVLDVRSLYPYVMQRYTYPCELTEVQNEPGIKETQDRLRLECCVCEAIVKPTDNVYPTRRSEGTYYTTGLGKYWLCGPELLRAIKKQQVRRICQIAWYKTADLFGPFVSHFYGARQIAEAIGNQIEADLCKLILNAMPAKFGQQTGEWKDDNDHMPDQPWGYWYADHPKTKVCELCRGIAGKVQARRKVKEAAHAFPAIPAYVCSYARVYMDELISIARSGDKVYYSAVDSIQCSAGAWQALALDGRIGPELGQLRHKGTFTNAEYRGVGDYSLEGKITRSGLPANAVHLGGDAWQYRDTESAAELIGHGPVHTLTERQLTIKLPHKYKFGHVAEDGWVTPFTESEIPDAK